MNSHKLFGADLGETPKQGLCVNSVYTGQAASLALGDHFLWPLYAGEGHAKPERQERKGVETVLLSADLCPLHVKSHCPLH